TDFRDTDVQQPKTTATLSCSSSWRAFSAKSGQFDAGSTTTGCSWRPSRPPFLFCWSISISTVSLSVVSLIAIVPESECRMPTLIGPACMADPVRTTAAATSTATMNGCKRLIFFPAPPLHLHLEADAELLVVGVDRREVPLQVEHHRARPELR